MAFKVRIFSGASDYETLHVAKLTCFPLEKRDYKPYSQARVCFCAEGMQVQLLAFEAEPLPESAMAAVFALSAENPPLRLTLRADGGFEAALDGEAARLLLGERVTAHTFTGEDLQGMYWGGNLLIPTAILEEYYPAFSVKAGETFRGNLYKLCENPKKPHFGCYYPADFEKPLSAPENLDAFVLIDY